MEHLEQQVVEQEQLHRKQLQEEKKSRKKAVKEADEDKAGLRARITSLQVFYILIQIVIPVQLF